MSYIGKALKAEPYSQGTTLSRRCQSMGRILANEMTRSPTLVPNNSDSERAASQLAASQAGAIAEPKGHKKRRLKSHSRLQPPKDAAII